MDYESYIADALEIVSAWEVPPEDFAHVVNDQARLMSGSHLEPLSSQDWPSPYESYRS